MGELGFLHVGDEDGHRGFLIIEGGYVLGNGRSDLVFRAKYREHENFFFL